MERHEILKLHLPMGHTYFEVNHFPLEEHDGVIERARTCVQLLRKDKLTDEEAETAANAARALKGCKRVGQTAAGLVKRLSAPK